MSPPPSSWRLAGALGASVALATGVALAGPPGADARRIVETGAISQGVPACRSCHGPEGEGVAVQNGPRLAHLDADYLQGQLDAFAAGTRRHPVMGPIARALTSDQRAALGAYFAGLPPPPAVSTPSAGAAERARGRSLALRGDWSRGVPSCASCHGPDGQGVGSVTPPLTGQTRTYLEHQLTAFRNGDRSSALEIMNGIARRLSPRQLRAAAAYYGALPATPAIPARSR